MTDTSRPSVPSQGPYSYQVERSRLFTEDGQTQFLKVRDRVKLALDRDEAFTMGTVMVAGDSYLSMACVDRLVELGEIVECYRTTGRECWGQFRVFADPKVSNR